MSVAALDGARATVMRALAGAMRGPEADRAKLLGVRGAALARSTAADRAVARSGTSPAIERYTGVLYDALDASSLGATERRRLTRSVLIVSGLWGLVAPSDPIPDYRLKMGARLGRLGLLSRWWREELTAAAVERAGRGPVWDLLPNEHAAAFAWPDDGPARTAVRFLEPAADGSLTAVSHWNKFLKGALVRRLLEEPATSASDLRRWRHPSGFRLDPSLTTTDGPLTTISLVAASPGR
jgi:hypothetical protein